MAFIYRNIIHHNIAFSVLCLIIISSCSESEKQILIDHTLAEDKSRIVIIDARIDYSKDFILPIPMRKTRNYLFNPACPFLFYDATKNEATIHSKYTKADLSQVKTWVLVKYHNLFNKIDYGLGFLYTNDTLNVKSIGLIGEHTFSLISNNSDLYLKTKFYSHDNAIKATYMQNFDPEDNNKITEHYQYKIINDVNIKISNKEYNYE